MNSSMALSKTHVLNARGLPRGMQMPSPRAAIKLQMPHPWDWQREQMPCGCLEEGGGNGHCWNWLMHISDHGMWLYTSCKPHKNSWPYTTTKLPFASIKTFHMEISLTCEIIYWNSHEPILKETLETTKQGNGGGRVVKGDGEMRRLHCKGDHRVAR